MSINIAIPTHSQIIALMNIHFEYPPTIDAVGYVGKIPLPYNIEALVSLLVKVASAPQWNPVNNQPSVPDNVFMEIHHHLAPFGADTTNRLVALMKSIAMYLIGIFYRSGWYDSTGIAPHRFVGFHNHTYDIELRSS